MRGPHSWRSNHAPLGSMANRHRSATQIRIVALFNRRIERVHIDVDDLAQHHGPAISRQEQKENSVQFGGRPQVVPSAPQWWRAATASSARLPGAPLLKRRSQTGVLVLLGCGRQRIRCASGESDYPGDVIDAKLGPRSLEVQPRLRGTHEPLGLSITHHPTTPLLLPTRTGTYLTAQIYKQRVPGKPNGGHSSISTVDGRIVPPRGIAVQDQILGRRRMR